MVARCLVYAALWVVSSSVDADDDSSLSLVQKRTRVLVQDADTAKPHVKHSSKQSATDGNPCAPSNRLIFHGMAVTRNNLGNTGPDGGTEGLVYENVFPNNGERIDLVINAQPGYERAGTRNNGVNNGVAKVNLVSGGKAELTFSFVDASSAPKTVGPFYMSYLDFDEQQSAGKAREMVRVRGYDSYQLTPTTIVSEDVSGDGSVLFSSTTFGNGADNVDDTHSMTQEQMDKSVSVLMPELQSFTVDFEVAPLPNSRSTNRFILFAGITNLVCDTSPTPSPTPPPTRPTTCGNACHAGMVYKKCAFWGDPHYTKTFGAAQHFDQHGFGVKTLAKTQCGSVEVQTVQCPWWHFNNNAVVAAGLAMRVGSDVVTVVATTVVNPGGISVSGGNPWTITSSDSCVSLWIRTNHQPPTPSKYYMDMELKVDDPAVDGTCSGSRQDSPTPQNEILFTDAQLQSLCGACRFACPGSLLSTGAVEEQPAPTAPETCEAAGIPYEEALKACGPLCKETEDGCDLLEDCALDFCSTDGDKAVVQEELADLKHFEDDDKNDEAGSMMIPP